MFLVDLDRLRMNVAVMLRRQAEDERANNKNDDALFLGGENEPLPEGFESGPPLSFQSEIEFLGWERTRTERYLPRTFSS